MLLILPQVHPDKGISLAARVLIEELLHDVLSDFISKGMEAAEAADSPHVAWDHCRPVLERVYGTRVNAEKRLTSFNQRASSANTACLKHQKPWPNLDPWKRQAQSSVATWNSRKNYTVKLDCPFLFILLQR